MSMWQLPFGTKSHPVWTFVLSIFVVFATIASMGTVNYWGTTGFVFVGVVPITIFFIGKYLIPLESLE